MLTSVTVTAVAVFARQRLSTDGHRPLEYDKKKSTIDGCARVALAIEVGGGAVSGALQDQDPPSEAV